MNPIIEGSVSFISLVIIIGVFLGLTLGAFLIFAKKDKNKGNVFLGLLIISLTLFLLASFLYSLGLLDDFPHVVRLHPLVALLLGPFVYFYVQATTQKGFKLVPKLWWHFIPAILHLLYYSPILLLDGIVKYNYHIDLFVTGETGESWYFPVMRNLHGLIYFFFSVRTILKYKDHLSNTSSFIDASFYRWLLFFSSALLLPALTLSVIVYIGLTTTSIYILYISIVCFLFAVYLATLLKPAIFHTFPHQMLIPESTEEKTQKYESSNLQETQKDKLVQKLLNYVDANKPYQEAELTLADLADQVAIPSHYLSQIINEKLDCNFLDFINGYRVKEAQQKLIDPNFNHYTIIAIAYEVGFNSKTAFYTAFKKHSDTTPSNYRKTAKAS